MVSSGSLLRRSFLFLPLLNAHAVKTHNIMEMGTLEDLGRSASLAKLACCSETPCCIRLFAARWSFWGQPDGELVKASQTRSSILVRVARSDGWNCYNPAGTNSKRHRFSISVGNSDGRLHNGVGAGTGADANFQSRIKNASARRPAPNLGASLGARSSALARNV
jgi:hypothetical protein